jgi:hypothetical protein
VYSSESCPTDDFCAEINGDTAISTASAPGADPQTTTRLGIIGDRISCASPSLCVAFGTDGQLWTSTAPGTASWTQTFLKDSDLQAIDCPSVSSCLVTDETGHLITTSDPTGGASAWTYSLIDPNGCDATDQCSQEQIVANSGDGVHTVATADLPGTQPFISDLVITGDTLSWSQDGDPESAALTP